MNDPARVNPYAAPAAVSAMPAASAPGAANANRWLRLGAHLLDGVIGAAAAIPGLIVLGIGAALSHGDRQGATVWVVLACGVIGLGLLALLIVNLVLLAAHGQTLAKRICGIRIVRADGTRCGLGRIFWLRMVVPNLIGGIPYVGLLFSLVDALFIFGEQQRCVHDLIADTRVVVA